jgi:hypothetical protein
MPAEELSLSLSLTLSLTASVAHPSHCIGGGGFK